jgi:pyruvate,water dikinase
MVAYGMLERQLRLGHAEPASVNRLLRALPGVPSSRPPVELWALSRQITGDPSLARLFAQRDTAVILDELRANDRYATFRQGFDRYLERWGFRSSAELMLTVPTLEEQPGPLVDLLREYARAGGEAPEVVMARQADARRIESRRLIAGLCWRAPHRALAVWRWLTWTQRAVTYRERVRLKQARLYTRVRDIARAIGAQLVSTGRLRQPDDVFWLTWQELDDLCDGRSMFPNGVASLVALRQDEHARLSAMAPPDTFEIAEGTYLATTRGPAVGFEPAAGDPGSAGLRTGASGDAASDTLTGTSACGGVITARAALLRDVDQSHLLSRGDVLVTRQTDPGWGPLFCLVSGLVIERGGMLSHGAIIAREFGLPCLVGVRDATRRIAHGSTVTVDGDRGACLIHREAGAAPADGAGA